MSVILDLPFKFIAENVWEKVERKKEREQLTVFEPSFFEIKHNSLPNTSHKFIHSFNTHLLKSFRQTTADKPEADIMGLTPGKIDSKGAKTDIIKNIRHFDKC